MKIPENSIFPQLKFEKRSLIEYKYSIKLKYSMHGAVLPEPSVENVNSSSEPQSNCRKSCKF